MRKTSKRIQDVSEGKFHYIPNKDSQQEFPKYEGESKKDTPHGFGTYHYSADERYRGYWNKGLKEGKGLMEYEGGISYSGDFKDGDYNGVGKLNLAQGRYLEGKFEHGKLHGLGEERRIRGMSIVGEFKFGLPNGLMHAYYMERETLYKDHPFKHQIMNSKSKNQMMLFGFFGNMVDNIPHGAGIFSQMGNKVLGYWNMGKYSIIRSLRRINCQNVQYYPATQINLDKYIYYDFNVAMRECSVYKPDCSELATQCVSCQVFDVCFPKSSIKIQEKLFRKKPIEALDNLKEKMVKFGEDSGCVQVKEFINEFVDLVRKENYEFIMPTFTLDVSSKKIYEIQQLIKPSNSFGQLQISRIDAEGNYLYCDSQNGKAEGKGIQYSTDGEFFKGNWLKGKRHGRGSLYTRKGEMYICDWKNGSINGKGKVFKDSGQVWKGQWKNDKLFGKGLVYEVDGEVIRKFDVQFSRGLIKSKKEIIQSDFELDFSKNCICPLSKSIMIDPVSVNCGHNFEKILIMNWIDFKKDKGEMPLCPVCKVLIFKDKINPNLLLRFV